MKMDKKDLKEKIIVLGVTVGLFFPVRIFFSVYVSEHWLGSLGVMSALAILLVVLIKKKKLGWFGIIFEKQMRKTVGGKTGKYLIGFAYFSLFILEQLYFLLIEVIIPMLMIKRYFI